ncbi:CoA transferase [Georgenia yuyongxinii]|uniref:CoA transferase n=1 Tax=Georgenia yuyongxinii TaxID=2589797 RepID=UPI00143D6E75|nr:CoA transferase [Georgenia yuyongxinii]
MTAKGVTETVAGSGGPLAGLRIVEVSAFVAAPLAGLTLAQLGAEVIRIDPLDGQMDFTRWPVTDSGESLFWSGLNKGKKSVTLDLRSPEGRKRALRLMTAPGDGTGIVLTNLSVDGWMSYETLRALREDVILVHLTGNADGSNAVDYTVNPASGFATATGEGEVPVNHLLPAWDVTSGLHLATAILAAERVRKESGQGQQVTVALSDVMLSVVSALGYIADVQVNGVSRPAQGNYLYGGFGKDFVTDDGRRIMVVAITDRQWRNLTTATGLAAQIDAVAGVIGADLSDEGGRYEAREIIAAVVGRWVAARSYAEVATALDGSGVLWGTYRTFGELVRDDPRCSLENPLFTEVAHPGIGTILTPRSPLRFSRTSVPPAAPSPVLGQHTAEVEGALRGQS